MSELNIHPQEERKAHIERAWSTRREDAQRYGEAFAERMQPTVQEALEGLQTLTTTLYIEHVDTHTDTARGLVGGDSAFVLERIERPSYLHGLTGFPEWPGVDPASDIDTDLSVEALENEARGAPYPENSTTGSHWLHQFTRSELAKLATYWYGVGAIDRLDGSIETRRLSELTDQLEEEKMGPFEVFAPGSQDVAEDGSMEDEYDRSDYDEDDEDEDEEKDDIDHLYDLTDEFHGAIISGTYTAEQLAADAHYRTYSFGTPSSDLLSLASEAVADIRKENGIDNEVSQ